MLSISISYDISSTKCTCDRSVFSYMRIKKKFFHINKTHKNMKIKLTKGKRMTLNRYGKVKT